VRHVIVAKRRHDMKMHWVVLGVSLMVAPLSVLAGEGMVPVRHIDVTGEGRLHVKPDKADIQFTVYAEHKILKDAKAAADAKLDASVAMLQNLGIAKGDVKTNYSSVMPRYNYVQSNVLGTNTNKQVFEAYEVNHTLTVTIKQMDLVGIVLQKLADIGIDRIGNVQYGLLDERPIKEKALSEAIANARRKADIAAAAMSVAVGGVISFTESGAQYTPMPMMAAPMMMKAMDAGGGVASAPPSGEIDVSQSVSISYAIKD
jgi:uncharacterized protein